MGQDEATGECQTPMSEIHATKRVIESTSTGRVGVVVITIASHAIGRGFNPRIRYFFASFA